MSAWRDVPADARAWVLDTLRREAESYDAASEHHAHMADDMASGKMECGGPRGRIWFTEEPPPGKREQYHAIYAESARATAERAVAFRTAAEILRHAK